MVTSSSTHAPIADLELIAQLKAIVGDAHVLTDAVDTAPYCRDWRGRYQEQALAVVLPKSTQEVSALVRCCVQADVAIVPQAGNTGLTGGAVASTGRRSVLLNVSRMNTIRQVDLKSNAMTVEAGCILQNVRDAAHQQVRQFPMMLGSVGSCEIGGLVSTNAGGTGVLRYGNMRELVLGLEVVLPNGEVWDGMRALRKDNTGYDLKQWFIGAEGTLGIVTAAVLKLFPALQTSVTAMVALSSVAHAVDLLHLLQARVGQRVEAFEIMSANQVQVVTTHGHGLSNPMDATSPWYVLMELADSDADWQAMDQLESILGDALEQGVVTDAVVATDLSKAEAIWALRHNISEANKRAGFTVSNDTSVPIGQLPAFIAAVEQRLHASIDGLTLCHAGHIGDGNIHVIAVLSREVYTTPQQCEDAAAVVNLIVHEESVRLGGSISAEHGIGKMHIERLARFTSPVELHLMRQIKCALDPKGLMNPEKIFMR